jgi:hypothetical protein
MYFDQVFFEDIIKFEYYFFLLSACNFNYFPAFISNSFPSFVIFPHKLPSPSIKFVFSLEVGPLLLHSP